MTYQLTSINILTNGIWFILIKTICSSPLHTAGIINCSWTPLLYDIHKHSLYSGTVLLQEKEPPWATGSHRSKERPSSHSPSKDPWRSCRSWFPCNEVLYFGGSGVCRTEMRIINSILFGEDCRWFWRTAFGSALRCRLLWCDLDWCLWQGAWPASSVMTISACLKSPKYITIPGLDSFCSTFSAKNATLNRQQFQKDFRVT